MRVHFKQTGGGLAMGGGTAARDSTGTAPQAASALKGFAIAGVDRKLGVGDSRFESPDTVVVWSDAVPNPTQVRYAWADNPACNLYNGSSCRHRRFGRTIGR